MSRASAYWIALALSTFLVIGLAVYGIYFHKYYTRFILIKSPPLTGEYIGRDKAQLQVTPHNIDWNSLVPFATFVVTSASTLSTILLGWRVDRRQAKELELKTKDLELKIQELEIKPDFSEM